MTHGLHLQQMWSRVTALLGHDILDAPEFVGPFTRSLKELANNVHIAGHFPLLLKVFQFMPESVVGIVDPATRPIIQFQNVGPQLFEAFARP